MFWMISQEAMGELISLREIAKSITAEQISAYTKAMSPQDQNPILQMDGDTAIITIAGVLTNKPSYFYSLFGGGNTAYSQIIDAIYRADANPNIKTIKLLISSPGGMITGMFDAMDVIASTEKNVEAIATGMLASAAYGLASQADRISVSNDSTQIGSIGVAIDLSVYPGDVSIASENAPNKRPDVTTPEGKAIVQNELNDIEKLFSTRIASGRAAATGKDISLATVNTDFGRGGVFLSGKALQQGMIDAILSPPKLSVVTQTAKTGKDERSSIMDLNKLKTEHTALYNEVMAAGVAEGVKQEKERTSAHLIMAESSGDFAFAATCIKDGKPATDQTVFAHHMSAAVKGKEKGNRAADDKAADPGKQKPKDPGASENAMDIDEVFAQVHDNLGLKATKKAEVM